MAVPILTVSAAGGGVLGWLVVRTVGGVVGCLARWRSILSSNACFRSRNCYVKKVSWRWWQVEKSRFIITPQDEHRIDGILPHPVGAATPLHQPFVCFQKGLQLQPEKLTRMTSPACLGAQVSEKTREFKCSADNKKISITFRANDGSQVNTPCKGGQGFFFFFEDEESFFFCF